MSSFEETFLGEGCDSAGDRWFAGFVRAVSSKMDLWRVDYWARSRSCSVFFTPLTRDDRSGPSSKGKRKKDETASATLLTR